MNPSIKVIVNKILRLKHFMASRLLGTGCIKMNDLIREWETGLGRQEPDLSNKMHRVAFISPSWNLVYKGTIKQHGQPFSRPRQTICAFPDSGHLHRVLLCFKILGQICFLACSRKRLQGGSWGGTLGRLEVPLELNWPHWAPELLGSSNSESASGHHQSLQAEFKDICRQDVIWKSYQGR